MTPILRVLTVPDEVGVGPSRFGPDDCYPGAVWLPVLGPSAFLLWADLARRLRRGCGELTVSPVVLAADLGLGSAEGTQSGVARALRRLERFGLLQRVADDLVVVRALLPSVSPAQLARLHPSIQVRHRLLLERARPHFG